MPPKEWQMKMIGLVGASSSYSGERTMSAIEIIANSAFYKAEKLSDAPPDCS